MEISGPSVVYEHKHGRFVSLLGQGARVPLPLLAFVTDRFNLLIATYELVQHNKTSQVPQKKNPTQILLKIRGSRQQHATSACHVKRQRTPALPQTHTSLKTEAFTGTGASLAPLQVQSTPAAAFLEEKGRRRGAFRQLSGPAGFGAAEPRAPSPCVSFLLLPKGREAGGRQDRQRISARSWWRLCHGASPALKEEEGRLLPRAEALLLTCVLGRARGHLWRPSRVSS